MVRDIPPPLSNAVATRAVNLGHAPGDRVTTIALGLRANWKQFTLLVVVNAFVGAMVGLERSVLPVIATEEFRITSTTAVLIVHRDLRAREGVYKSRIGLVGRSTRPSEPPC
jgi:hypothetical protein